MKNVIGVSNPYGLVQQAGRKRRRNKTKAGRSLRKKHRKTRRR